MNRLEAADLSRNAVYRKNRQGAKNAKGERENLRLFSQSGAGNLALARIIKFFASVQSQRDLGGLQLSALGRRMGGQKAGRRDEEMLLLGPAFPPLELPDGGLEHLEIVEIGVLAHRRQHQRIDQRTRPDAASRR